LSTGGVLVALGSAALVGCRLLCGVAAVAAPPVAGVFALTLERPTATVAGAYGVVVVAPPTGTHGTVAGGLCGGRTPGMFEGVAGGAGCTGALGGDACVAGVLGV